MIERGYVRGPHGQIHFRRAAPPAGVTPRGTVVLFHETPVNSIVYEPLLRELARDRVAIAIDTPGFGESEPIADHPVALEEYARTVAAAIDALDPKHARPLAVFGFHTGAALAVETALQRPNHVDVLLLGGVPYRTAEERQERLDKLPRDEGADALKARLDEYWNLAAGHPPGVSKERAMDLFVAMVQGRDRYWWAYDALWRYPLEQRLEAVRQPALVLAPHEMLHDQTLRAAAHLKNPKVVDLPDLQEWVLDLGAARLAQEMRTFMDEVAARGSGGRAAQAPDRGGPAPR